jgi:ATP synthase F1 gamma subunit
MASSLRELRERRRSVTTTKKITRAMELIAASRIVKAQQAARAALPYTLELDRAMSALALANEDIEHPLLTAVPNPKRSALLVITSDRGLAGAYSTNAIKSAEQLRAKLRAEGQEVDLYVAGQKGVGYYDFRNVPVKQSWTGFSDRPTYAHAREIADVLTAGFLADTEAGGVDQLHTVGTRFVSMVKQVPLPRRLRVRAGPEERAGRRVPPVRGEPHLLRAADVRGVGVGEPPARDEVGDGQRADPDRAADPRGQPGASGRDHPRNHRNRRRRLGAGRISRKRMR